MNNSFKISEKITYEYIDENIFILHIENGNYYKLSKTASLIWSEIEKGAGPKDIKINIESTLMKLMRLEKILMKL